MSSFYSGRFGDEPLFSINHDEAQIVKQHYQGFLSNEQYHIDDITWNDLDLDRMYEKMNMTYCGAGDIMLYCMLRQPCLKQAELTDRLAIMKWAKTQEAERDDVLDTIATAGKRYKEDMEEPFQSCHTKANRTKISYILLGMMYSCIPLSVLFPQYFVVPGVCLLLVNIFRYWTLHKQLEHYLDPLVYIVDHIEVLHRLADKEFTDLPQVSKELQSLSSQLKTLRKKSSLSYFENTAGVLNFLTQKESIYYDHYAAFIYEHADLVRKGMAAVGKLDACISAASYQIYGKLHTDVSFDQQKRAIKAQAMVHPFVENCVANDIDIYENRLLTGSNATGKSTYLKMVVLNAVLAQSFGMVFAKNYHSVFFKMATSMTIHDDLKRQESTFVAEVKSLKHLLDLCSDDIPSLCVIDEILRGTNTLERIASSSVILHEFAQRNCLCLGATHDMELTQLLQGVYANYHFSETIKDNKMSFDYKIHKGPTRTRNAIALLNVFGYQKKLVNNAQKRLAAFETSGEWEVIV